MYPSPIETVTLAQSMSMGLSEALIVLVIIAIISLSLVALVSIISAPQPSAGIKAVWIVALFLFPLITALLWFIWGKTANLNKPEPYNEPYNPHQS